MILCSMPDWVIATKITVMKIQILNTYMLTFVVTN